MKNEKFRNPEAILDIQDKPTFPQWLLLSVQHLFTMFGSTVLVPLLYQNKRKSKRIYLRLIFRLFYKLKFPCSSCAITEVPLEMQKTRSIRFEPFCWLG